MAQAVSWRPLIVDVLVPCKIERSRHFNTLLLFGINIIISGLNSIVKGGMFLSFTFNIVVISPDDGRQCWPKHVAYVRNKYQNIYGDVLVG